MVGALSGDRVGRLRPGTPAPPLVHEVDLELERLKLDGTGAEPVLEERWTLTPGDGRLPALIEAGAYGATLEDAAGAVLEERVADAGGDVGRLAVVLFDAALCGRTGLSDRIAGTIEAAIAGASELGGLGEVLETTLGLWRHDRLLGTAGSPLFGRVIQGCVTRVLWLVEGVRGGPEPADLRRLRALSAIRDALLHAAGPLGLDRDVALAVAGRVSVAADAPPDLRGGKNSNAWRSAWAGRWAPPATRSARCSARRCPTRSATGSPGCSRWRGTRSSPRRTRRTRRGPGGRAGCSRCSTR
jgi:hypothetical protein